MNAQKLDCRSCLHYNGGYSVKGLHLDVVDCAKLGDTQRVLLINCKHKASYEPGVDQVEWEDDDG